MSDAAPAIEPGRPDGAPWTVSTTAERRFRGNAADLAARLKAVERGLVVAGWGCGLADATAVALADALGWPLLADVLSGVRTGANAISTYDALLRVPDFADRHRPELVLRFGAPLTSKVTTAWLDATIEQIVVDPHGRWLDPHRAASERLAVDAEPLARHLADALPAAPAESAWRASWRSAEHRARRAIDALLDADDGPFDPRVARDVYAAVPEGSALLVASSMPVRDLEWFAAPRRGVRVHANRGANGIDGLVSTTLGIAAARRGPTVALLGDLAFLHDSNGLLAAPALTAAGVAATIVVVDNRGGGIFDFLPAGRVAEAEALFTTPPAVDSVALAAAYGVAASRVEEAAAVGPAVRAALAEGGVQVVVVPTDRTTNVRRHDALWAAVGAELESEARTARS